MKMRRICAFRGFPPAVGPLGVEWIGEGPYYALATESVVALSNGPEPTMRSAGERRVAESMSGRAIIIAAVLVSFSIIGGSFFIANSLDRTTEQIELATTAL